MNTAYNVGTYDVFVYHVDLCLHFAIINIFIVILYYALKVVMAISHYVMDFRLG